MPWFADWCAIALEDDGRLRTLKVAHAQPQHEALIEELQASLPSLARLRPGAYRVLRTGESELVREVSDEFLAASAQDAEHLRLLRLLNFRSGLLVPLKTRGRVLGVITWVTGEQGRRFTEDDRTSARTWRPERRSRSTTPSCTPSCETPRSASSRPSCPPGCPRSPAGSWRSATCPQDVPEPAATSTTCFP